MNATGIVRKLDKLGRIVLPKELRRELRIEENAPLEFFVDGHTVILKRCSPSCILCGDKDNLIVYKGKNICERCFTELKAL